MILSELEVLGLAKDKDPDEWIELARKKSDNLKMHFYGTGLTEFLTQIQGLESASQIKLRKKYAISNEALIDALLQPVNNAWNAKGGLTNIDATDKAKEILNEAIKDSKDGSTIKHYLQNVWFDRFVTDPNGLLFIESTKETAYCAYKSIHDINKMRVSGIKPEYIVFEPDVSITRDVGVNLKEEKSTIEKLWVVDDKFYYRVVRELDQVHIAFVIDNVFEVVPAVQNSPIFDTDTRIKISPIHKQLELLESYLIDNSVNNIYKKLHGFPIFWMYGGKCESCKGTGEVTDNTDGANGTKTCHACNGSKQSSKKDVSDGIILATPRDSDAPTIAPDVAGYVQPALETWQEQRTELQSIFNLIYFSQWGTTIERVDNETATGRFIDAQPVVNRLHMYSDTFELIHTSVLQLFAKFYLQASDATIHVSYGRRYLVETPDQIYKKYLETIEKGADNSTKDLTLQQFYESEFQSDEFMLNYFLKLIQIEPLVHYNIPDVLEMEVGETIKRMKVAFPTWKAKTPMIEVIEKDLDKLIKDLNEFTNETIREVGSSHEEQKNGEADNEEGSSHLRTTG